MIRDLSVYQTFVAIVEQPSLTAAAERLGRSLQSVSRDLGRLEADLGAPLLLRTTRRRQLTPEGQEFYTKIKRLLAELEGAEDDVRTCVQRVAGTLKVAASTMFGPRVLTPLIADFLNRHPELSVELELTDAFIDPAASGADVTIRIGDTPSSTLMSRRLGQVRRVAFAAPAYLAARGHPQRPADLANHECVVWRGDRDAAHWVLGSETGMETVSVKGRFQTNSVPALIQAVIHGLGIGTAAYWQVREFLEDGRLELILPDVEPRPRPIQALWAPAQQLPPRTRLFIEFLAERLSVQPL